MAALAPIRQAQADLDADRLLTVSEVAQLLNMSEAWVRQHSNGMRRPAIPSVKLGKSVRYRRVAVLDFITSMERIT
jgi:predicted DNA-binding transcriptional regulator AlpA